MSHYPIPRLLLQESLSPPALNAREPPVPMYSDMVIILACLLCGIVSVLGLMALARCTWVRHHNRHRSTPLAATTTTTGGGCLKRDIVKSLPRLIFKSKGGGAKEVGVEGECVICLAEFVDGEEIRVLPGCSHVFHIGCIDRWLIGSLSSSCPSCRQCLVCTTSVTMIIPVPQPLPLPPPPQRETEFFP